MKVVSAGDIGKWDLRVLAIIGALYEEGKTPPYSVIRLRRKAEKLGWKDYPKGTLGIDLVLAGLSRKGCVSLVMRKGRFYVYPITYTDAHPDEKEVTPTLEDDFIRHCIGKVKRRRDIDKGLGG